MGNAESNKTLLAVKWAVPFLVAAIIMLMPMGEGVTPEIRKFMALTLWAIFMFMFELMDTTAVALGLMFGYALFGVVPMATALSVWTNQVVWMLFASLIILNVVQKTKLLERISYNMIAMTNGSYRSILMALATICIVVTFLVPSITTVVLLLAIAFGLCQALQLEKGKIAGGIMIVTTISFVEATNFIFIPQAVGLSSAMAGVAVDMVTMLKHNIVFVPLVYIMAYVVSVVMKPDQPFNAKDIAIQKKKELGSMDSGEKKTLAVLVALVVSLLTAPFHGINMTYCYMIAALLMFVPKIGIGEKKDIATVNIGILAFTCGCMTIGIVGTEIGFGELVAAVVMPFLAGQGPYVFIILSWLLGVVLNFFMTPAAIMTVLSGPLSAIATSLGFTAYPVAYIVNLAGNNLLFPYENTSFLIAYGFGLMLMKDFIKVGAVKMVVCFIYTIVIGVTYWNFIGLF